MKKVLGLIIGVVYGNNREKIDSNSKKIYFRDLFLQKNFTELENLIIRQNY